MTIFFTADTHFGHANIIKYCARPFENAEEMDEEMILRWNNHVKVDDTVYHLGDFCWGEPSHYVHRLNGKITFLRGSHDKNMDAYALRDRLLTIQPLQDEFGNPRSIILCHYAMRSWPNSHYASWHLYGHHHGKLPPYGLSFDVGVDCWDFAPVSLGQVEEKMKTLKPIVDYRKEG
jgi:calcineurin-like phosphoesterase family protein